MNTRKHRKDWAISLAAAGAIALALSIAYGYSIARVAGVLG